MNCLSGRVSEFVETAAFGCPAAPAADWPVPRKFSAEMTDLEHERHGFHGRCAAKQTSRPSGDGQPKAAVPTQ
jgi:hypothetical protein